MTIIYKPWMPNIPNRLARTNCDQLTIGNLNVSFQRTLRLPEDGKTHGLPPSLGRFPVRLVEDYKDKVPAKWLEHGGVFLPLYQREALWLSFRVDHSVKDVHHCAVKVATGKVNAVSGKPWSDKLEKAEDAVLGGKDPVQDYMVCPDQPWLDGFNTGDGTIRQFVAMPLGQGYTVEKQVTGKEDTGGIQIAVFPAKPGAIPTPPSYRSSYLGGGLESAGGYYTMDAWASMGMDEDYYMPAGATNSVGSTSKGMSSGVLYSATRSAKSVTRLAAKGAEMGLAAGGKMNQKIYADKYGIESWDVDNGQRLFIHFVNAQMWTELTGEAPPATPVSAHTYTQHGYPWFSIYDEGVPAVQGFGTLANVKPVSEMDKEKGFESQQDDSPLDESANTVKLTKKPKKPVMLGNKPVADGNW